MGSAGEIIWEKLRRDYGFEFDFMKMGEQPAVLVSQLLQLADFGIATSPLQLIGKSGSVAAMLEHGLPVIANRDDWYPRGAVAEKAGFDSLVHPIDSQLEVKLDRGFEKRTPASGLPRIAAQFINSLNSANT